LIRFPTVDTVRIITSHTAVHEVKSGPLRLAVLKLGHFDSTGESMSTSRLFEPKYGEYYTPDVTCSFPGVRRWAQGQARGHGHALLHALLGCPSCWLRRQTVPGARRTRVIRAGCLPYEDRQWFCLHASRL